MTARHVRLTCLAALLTAPFSAPCAPPARGAAPVKTDGPVLDAGFVGSPEFDAKGGNLSAGTAFLVTLPGQKDTVLLTALHIFGTAGGLPKDLKREELPAFTKRVTLRDLLKAKTLSARIEAMAIPGAVDLAPFRVAPAPGMHPHALAAKDVQVGDAIWLVASLASDSGKDLLHRAVVTDGAAGEAHARFDDQSIVTRGASGAPYINAAGEVVGVHLGSIKTPGNIRGSFLPAEAIITELRGAAPAAPAGAAGRTLRTRPAPGT